MLLLFLGILLKNNGTYFKTEMRKIEILKILYERQKKQKVIGGCAIKEPRSKDALVCGITGLKLFNAWRKHDKHK